MHKRPQNQSDAGNHLKNIYLVDLKVVGSGGKGVFLVQHGGFLVQNGVFR